MFYVRVILIKKLEKRQPASSSRFSTKRPKDSGGNGTTRETTRHNEKETRRREGGRETGDKDGDGKSTKTGKGRRANRRFGLRRAKERVMERRKGLSSSTAPLPLLPGDRILRVYTRRQLSKMMGR